MKQFPNLTLKRVLRRNKEIEKKYPKDQKLHKDTERGTVGKKEFWDLLLRLSNNFMQIKLPSIPKLLQEKIYKTGQTRGADDDVIFQNRVLRNNTVLIPSAFLKDSFKLPEREKEFENGYIVLIPPSEYFENNRIEKDLAKIGLKLGTNAVVFYETRSQWVQYDPEKLGWKPAQSRRTPLKGNYIARIPATTSHSKGERIVRGFTKTSNKGAGIRIFEYASSKTISECRDQLETLFWLCTDSELVAAKNGMTTPDITIRRDAILKSCTNYDLLDYKKLINARVINKEHKTICPLCLEELSAEGFFARMQQAAGREVPDITVTEINLFHIEELRTGIYNHRPYNIGWGHHHCNVVTKDSGILPTLIWLKEIIRRNIESGYLD